MKRILYYLLSICFLINCNTEKKTTSFIIKGKLENYTKGKIYLLRAEGKKRIPIDSVEVQKNGEFLFKGTVKMPEMYFVKPENGKTLGFFLTNSEISINANVNNIDDAKITGSPEQDKYNEFLKNAEPFFAQMDETNSKIEKTTELKEIKQQENQRNELENELEIINQKYKEYCILFAKKNAESVVSPYVIWREASYLMSLSELDNAVKTFKPKIQQSVYVEILTKMLSSLQNLEPGKEAPNFCLADTTGKSISLNSFRGKYVLLDFWASWCPDCRREMPVIVNLWKKYKNKGLIIVSISLDKERDAWINAIKKEKIEFITLSDLKGWDCSAGKLYAISWIPQTFLLDKEGKIIAKGLSANKLNTELENHLK